MAKSKGKVDPFTECTNLLRNNEGISISSQLLRSHIENKTKPSQREMVAISKAMERAAANGKDFANRRCPAGVDPSWLYQREKRESIELKNKESGPKAKRRKVTTQLLDSLDEFNKEIIKPSTEARNSPRLTTPPSRFSPSDDNDEVGPFPKNGEMFECVEAMEHLKTAKYRHPLMKSWVENEFIPVSASHCALLWRKYVQFELDGGEPPCWKTIIGQKQLASTEEFMAACKNKEKDGHMILEKKDIAEVNRDQSKVYESKESLEIRKRVQTVPSVSEQIFRTLLLEGFEATTAGEGPAKNDDKVHRRTFPYECCEFCCGSGRYRHYCWRGCPTLKVQEAHRRGYCGCSSVGENCTGGELWGQRIPCAARPCSILRRHYMFRVRRYTPRKWKSRVETP